VRPASRYHGEWSRCAAALGPHSATHCKRCSATSTASAHNDTARFARFPSPSSATNCAVRDAKQRDDAPMADHHVQWSRSILDGLSRQSADDEQTRHQIAAATVTFQAQRSTVTTCVAGDPPLRDNRLLTCTCSSLHRASRAVVSAGAGPEADIVLLEHRHLCAYWAPCQPTALNLVTQASDIHLFSSQAHRVFGIMDASPIQYM
jgi:hypothetical protein